MSRGIVIAAVVVLAAISLSLWLAGGPAHAGALAGVSGSQADLAVGLAWIGVVPLVALMVPALLFTLAAEQLATIRARRRARAR